jgi:hypothetical protein
MRSTIGAACFVVGTMIAAPAWAWDFPGHRIVGAIADLILQQHDPTAHQRVSELLEKQNGGTIELRSLSQVAVFPDCAIAGVLLPMKRKHMRSAIRTTINSTSPMCRCSSRLTSRAAPEPTASMSCK